MIHIDLLLMYIKIIYFINFNTKESGSARSRSVRDSDPNKIGSVNQDCPGLPTDDPGKSPAGSRTRGQPCISVHISLTIYRLSAYPTSPTIDNCQSPLIKPAVEPTRITPEELQLFQNPENLHGKQFILSPVLPAELLVME